MKIDYLRLWISNEFVNEHFLPAMNANLALSREHGAKSGRRYRHQATEADFWFWLAHYFAYHLIAPTEFRTHYEPAERLSWHHWDPTVQEAECCHPFPVGDTEKTLRAVQHNRLPPRSSWLCGHH